MKSRRVRTPGVTLRPGLLALRDGEPSHGILLPPSIAMILYAVAAEQSFGRLFLAAIGPALLLVALFAGYATPSEKLGQTSGFSRADPGGRVSPRF